MTVYWLEGCQSISMRDYRAWLSLVGPAQQEKILQMQSARAQKLGIMGQLLLRERLCSLTGEENRRLAFGYSQNGKPYLQGYPHVFFNLSHSKDSVACVLSRQPIGLDIQAIGPYRPRVVKRFFTKEEQELLFSTHQKDALFAGLWTRKEAYGKYLGCGITFSLLQQNTLYRSDAAVQTYLSGQYALSVCAKNLLAPLRVVKMGAKSWLEYAQKALGPVKPKE